MVDLLLELVGFLVLQSVLKFYILTLANMIDLKCIDFHRHLRFVLTAAYMNSMIVRYYS